MISIATDTPSLSLALVNIKQDVTLVKEMARKQKHTHKSILDFRPHAMQRQDIILETVAEQLSPENADAFFRALRKQGFRRMSETLGLDEAVFRLTLVDYTRSQLGAECGIVLAWSSEQAVVDPEYVVPSAVSILSDLLQAYMIESGLFIERNYATWGDHGVRWLTATTELYLDQAKLLLKATMAEVDDPHQFVHVDEVFTTFFMTVLQMLDAMVDFPDKMESETRPAELTLEVHPALSGLMESAYLFADTDLLDAEATAAAKTVEPEIVDEDEDEDEEGDWEAHPDSPKQLTRRLSLDTDRRGKDISFDEIANIYRTSRVTISNVVKRIKIHMREKIDVSDLDCADAFHQPPQCGTLWDA